MGKYKEIDIQKVRSYSIRDRKSKVSDDQLAKVYSEKGSFDDFLKSIPSVLVGQDFHALIDHLVYAIEKNKPVLFMMGAHVIKVGLSPLVIDLMKHQIISGLTMNGAGAIHDVELACFGQTSEDVAETLKTGEFGMVKETADFLNLTVKEGQKSSKGFGESLGERLIDDSPQFVEHSLLAQAYKANVPVTVHVGMGTDIVHQHPSADGAAIGDLSLRDFRILAQLITRLNDGGVVLLFGSSVLLPEVFLKALTVARNIEGKVEGFITANFDMIKHYRSTVNVVNRPTQDTGKGYSFTGHHEIMLPLVCAALKSKLSL